MSPESRPPEPDPAAAAQPGEKSPDIPSEKLSYPIILRHLAKFRDGARSLLELFDTHLPTSEEAPPEVEPAAAAEKSPLERRIERHMNRVDRALARIRDLNPEHRSRAELAPEVRQKIEQHQRTIEDIVGAELHFWSAAIENAPLDRFDAVEQRWIMRILRLADRIGVDDEHEEHLKFLKDWAALEHG